MKKLIIVLSLSFSVMLMTLFGGMISNAQSPVTTIPQTTTVTVTQSTTQINLDQLINSIYSQVREQIYDQVYQELVSMIGDELYSEIHQSVLDRLEELVRDGSIPVTVDVLQDKIHAVIAVSNHSVFGVTTYLGATAKSLGSGVVYRFDQDANRYYLITNHHVIDGGDNYRIVFENNATVEATLHGFDQSADIAILSFSANQLNQTVIVSPLASDDSAQPGDFLIAVGNPRGYSFYGSTTLGVVSGINRNVDGDFFVAYLQHDASINSGNSGGPVYNLSGEVIGINVSKYVSDDIEGMGFAIPIRLVKRLITLIESNTMPDQTIKSTFGSLRDIREIKKEENTITVSSLVINEGLTLTNPTITLPEAIRNGLLVQTILASGSFQGTNITVGDLIAKVNDITIQSASDFYRTIYDQFIKGDQVSITYYVFDSTNLRYQANPQTIQITLR